MLLLVSPRLRWFKQDLKYLTNDRTSQNLYLYSPCMHNYTNYWKYWEYCKHSCIRRTPNFQAWFWKNFQKSTLVKKKKLVIFAATLISYNSYNLNWFPYSLWLTTLVFIAKAHSWNQNNGIWMKIKCTRMMQNDSLVTIQHGNVHFCISCVYQDVWKSSIGEKLVAKQEFDNAMNKHVVKVVLGN